MTTTLALKNPHIRDQYIQFEEVGHKYTILSDPDSKYTSVTTWNHTHFPVFDADAIIANMMKGKGWKTGHKYWGLNAVEIKAMWSNNGSSAGTELHYNIECFMNMNMDLNMDLNMDSNLDITHQNLLDHYHLHGASIIQNTSVEWQYFLQFVKAFPHFKPYRTEWTVFHEDIKLAGSIDMVYENPDGTLMIYDWKRSKEIVKSSRWCKNALTDCISSLPDTNFWHYALQLNTYKAIIEAKYGKKVTDLYLVRLHPENNPRKTFELIKVPILQDSIDQLFELRNKECKYKDKKCDGECLGQNKVECEAPDGKSYCEFCLFQLTCQKCNKYCEDAEFYSNADCLLCYDCRESYIS